MSDPDPSRWERRARRSRRLGWMAVAVLAATAALWTALAPVAGAVQATGVVRPVHERVAVTVQDAGVVSAWHVRDALAVEAGQLLVEIEEPDQVAAQAALVASMAAERLRLQRLRLQAQAGASAPTAPSLPAPADVEHGLWRQEQALLRAGWQQQRALQRQLAEQSGHAGNRAAALERAIASARRALALAQSERQAREGLLASGYISQAKWAEFERELQEASSRLDALQADHAEALENWSQLQGRAALEAERYAEGLALEQAQSLRRIEELEPRVQAAQARVKRLQLRAPQTGRIVDMVALSEGSTLRAGQRLFDIVPESGDLQVRALVRPEDIAHVQAGASARLQVTAYPSRHTPTLHARVTQVAADLSRDEGESRGHFTVWLAPQQPAPVVLSVGMSVQVFIETAPRTPLDYWLAPLNSALQRAAREP